LESLTEPRVLRLGFISDTHGHMDDRILYHLEGVDEIWHAGDIGSSQVIDQLSSIAKVYAVFGNIDSGDIRVNFPEYLHRSLNGLKLMMTHIVGKPGSYTPTVRNMITAQKPGILVCGHSHIARVQYDQHFSMLYINPGAAGYHGFHRIRTLMRLDVSPSGKAENLRVIELGANKKGA
jgi:putative phosphoesterase